MKKFSLFFGLISLSLVIATPVFAENATTSGKTNREDFRAKMTAIRDEKKKALLERLDTRMKELNTNRTTTLLRHLTTIESILTRIEARALEVEKTGKDISAVKTAIDKARAAIASAKSIVTAQAVKTYEINITTEDKLGTAVSTTRITLARDIQAAHQSIVTARKAVRDVLKALAKVVGEKLTSTVEE